MGEGSLKDDGKLHWSDGDVWSRILPVGASQWIFSLKDNPERARYEREMIERIREEEKEKEEEAKVYIGRPDLPPSFMGGGWGGPKERNDTDDRFMLRGEARQLPENLYKKWQEEHLFKKPIKKKTVASSSSSSSDSSSEEEKKKKKKEKKKKEKDKKKKDKKSKKGKKSNSRKKKGKKEKDKKNKKEGKKNKKRKSMES